MAKTNIWCNMMNTIFYIFGIIYYLQLWFIEDFNPVGREFANLVILGLIINIIQNERQQ